MYYVIFKELRTKKQRPTGSQFEAEGVKISPDLSEISPTGA
jgi:hypothetical protein